MNWYKKSQIYKEAFRNPMDSATNIISKKIFNLITNAYKNNKLFNTLQSDKQFININPIQIKYPGFTDRVILKINIVVLNKTMSRTFSVNGGYSGGYRYIEINIELTKDFSKKDFNYFYIDTVIAVRHELEHMHQDQKGWFRKYDKGYDYEKIGEFDHVKNFREHVKYIYSKFETPSIIKSFVLACKKNKKNIYTEMTELIHDLLFSTNKNVEEEIKKKYGLEAEHAERQLINHYKNQIELLFPNLKIEDENYEID